jgi:acyl-CoA thioester hydrolase
MTKTKIEFLWSIRVYYEDTDAGGIVYYANYLKFFERARTELLRSLGFEQDQLMQKGMVFVVKNVNVDYLSPVQFNDKIEIRTHCKILKKASIEFFQTVYKEDMLCCQGTIKIICLNLAQFRPTKMPNDIYQGLLNYAE